ncbi:MAG: MBL fold metallo-hydrolase, partial [Planctomycetota bacterium]
MKKTKIVFLFALGLGVVLGIVLTQSTQDIAKAAQEGGQAGAKDNYPLGRKPAAIVDGQYPASYFPNTEVLNADEMRITALGTGMPNQTKKAVSISYLVELGNGDKFLFDVGSGMLANLFSLRPDFSKIDKVFASHLHVDHVGDFMGVHIGGWLSG